MTAHTPGPCQACRMKETVGGYVTILCPLHAAAPELLEALEEMMYYDDGGYRGDKARAAIAKACGVES